MRLMLFWGVETKSGSWMLQQRLGSMSLRSCLGFLLNVLIVLMKVQIMRISSEIVLLFSVVIVGNPFPQDSDDLTTIDISDKHSRDTGFTQHPECPLDDFTDADMNENIQDHRLFRRSSACPAPRQRINLPTITPQESIRKTTLSLTINTKLTEPQSTTQSQPQQRKRSLVPANGSRDIALAEAHR